MAGFFERLKAGLSRTAEAIANLLARPMDAASAEELRERLIAADFGPATAEEVVEAARAAWKNEAELRKTSPAEAAAASIVRALGGETAPGDPLSKPHVIMLLGVNGAGKTTTAAKAGLALAPGRQSLPAGRVRHVPRGGRRTAFRLGGPARRRSRRRRRRRRSRTAVAFDAVKAGVARGADLVILDTAGRLHTKAHLLEELRKVVRVTTKAHAGAPHEKWLVLDGSLGANSIEQARIFHEAVGLTGLIVTKLDGTARGGALVAVVREQLGVPAGPLHRRRRTGRPTSSPSTRGPTPVRSSAWPSEVGLPAGAPAQREPMSQPAIHRRTRHALLPRPHQVREIAAARPWPRPSVAWPPAEVVAITSPGVAAAHPASRPNSRA
jgi:fused signal recognition particle receptor